MVGFIAAKAELASQVKSERIDTILLAAGSGTTLAGVLAGAAAFMAGVRFLGISVGRPRLSCTIPLYQRRRSIAGLLQLLDPCQVNLRILDGYIGTLGYPDPTPEKHRSRSIGGAF
ncbi:MAG: hypothetical protein AB1497_06305 [Bacillota bacterium]